MAKSGNTGTVVLFAVLSGAGLLIYSGLTGVNLSDAALGKGRKLDAKGGKQTAPDNVEGDPNSSGTTTDNPITSDSQTSTSGAIPGSPVPGQSPHSSTHPTGGLPGFPAYDYMAPAGTPCVAPVSGTILRLSGKDPSLGGSPGGPLGYSIYLRGNNGKTYYMTHLDNVSVKVGQRVVQGKQIAVVASGPASWSSPHVHMGISGI